METATRNGHVIELRDESNRLVGYYVPVPVHAEVEAEVNRLTAELTSLRHELDEVRADRDRFKKSVYEMAKEFLPLDEWDKESLETTDGVPLDQILGEFEQSPGAK
jgi:hypothetical protein